MNPIDEFLHQTRLVSQGQAGDYRPFVWGHISVYDPQLHRIRAIVPTLRTDAGTPVLSPWMPLGSLMVGNGWGIQYIPVGGSTFENPTVGELVQIHIIERTNGITLGAHLHFSQQMMPPIPNGNPGDLIMQGPNGNYVYLQSNASGKKITVNSATEIDVGTLANEVVRLLREEAALDIYNNHTHGGVAAGSSNTDTPNQQMTSSHLTATLKAN